jgi:hypothetical protein
MVTPSGTATRTVMPAEVAGPRLVTAKFTSARLPNPTTSAMLTITVRWTAGAAGGGAWAGLGVSATTGAVVAGGVVDWVGVADGVGAGLDETGSSVLGAAVGRLRAAVTGRAPEPSVSAYPTIARTTSSTAAPVTVFRRRDEAPRHQAAADFGTAPVAAATGDRPAGLAAARFPRGPVAVPAAERFVRGAAAA